MQMSVALGQLAEAICVVKITGRDRKVSYAIMKEGEFEELLSRIDREEDLYRKVIAHAREAWKDDPPVDKPFPMAAVSVPNATVVDEAEDMADAREILAEHEERMVEYEKRDDEREERRLEKKHTRESWSNEPGRERRRVKVNKEAMAREREEEAAKEELYEHAREAYRKSLRELWRDAE